MISIRLEFNERYVGMQTSMVKGWCLWPKRFGNALVVGALKFYWGVER